ncbi:hypothetical protein BGZ49_003692 [Haplosporangium sp. Z 27]|nr:hypothetical protein BGZ49_003692 [Haplosporangium sp. Z 27]
MTESIKSKDSVVSFTSYLESLYERRFYWARPWVGTVFTAGTQSTQRVEKAHHILKYMLDRKTTLAELVKKIEERVKRETDNQSFRAYVDDIKFRKQDWLESEKLFRQVAEVNARYLGSYAKYHILWQLTASFYYSFCPIKYQGKNFEKMSLKFLVGGS